MPYRRTPGIQARLDAQRGMIVGAAGALLAE
ncbi:MAG: TetR/AcrR family transcriptional regulator, partial [Jatrophihabitantaceae bacterium]